MFYFRNWKGWSDSRCGCWPCSPTSRERVCVLLPLGLRRGRPFVCCYRSRRVFGLDGNEKRGRCFFFAFSVFFVWLDLLACFVLATSCFVFSRGRFFSFVLFGDGCVLLLFFRFEPLCVLIGDILAAFHGEVVVLFSFPWMVLLLCPAVFTLAGKMWVCCCVFADGTCPMFSAWYRRKSDCGCRACAG